MRIASLPVVGTPPNVQLRRITDFVGIEEEPAVSPDGKTVAFMAPANGTRQVWVRLLAGGAPLQVTHDAADHAHPRWAPDSSSLIYYSSAAKEGDPGTLWEVAALGGTLRLIGSSRGGGDISHDGRCIATFETQDNRTVLAVYERDGRKPQRAAPLPALAEFDTPRWSPDDRWIAFVGAIEIGQQSCLRHGRWGWRAEGSCKRSKHSRACLAAGWFRPCVRILGGKHDGVSADLQPANRLT